MNDKRLLLPSDRLSVLEHVQLFCDIQNYPMEIFVDRQSCLVYQNDVYNYLLRSVPFVAQTILRLQNATARTWERFGDPSFHVHYATKNRQVDRVDAGAPRERRKSASARRARGFWRLSDPIPAPPVEDCHPGCASLPGKPGRRYHPVTRGSRL